MAMNGFSKSFIAQPGRLEQGPVGSTFVAFFDLVRAHGLTSLENKKRGCRFWGSPVNLFWWLSWFTTLSWV